MREQKGNAAALLPIGIFLVIFLGSWLHDRDVLPEQTGNMLGLMVLRLSYLRTRTLVRFSFSWIIPMPRKL